MDEGSFVTNRGPPRVINHVCAYLSSRSAGNFYRVESSVRRPVDADLAGGESSENPGHSFIIE